MLCGLEEGEGFLGEGRKEAIPRCGASPSSRSSRQELLLWAEHSPTTY